MSAHDQCPSSKKNGKPGKEELARIARDLPTLAGQAGQPVWRSLEEIADDPDFRERLEREFPSGASELVEPSTRRTFLKLMGAGVALAGAATIPGCRRPDHKIMPYSRNVPEEIIPGKPLFYATSYPRPGGGAEGLLVETHEGRPTKIEGNPLHPFNQGKSTVWAQASVLDMYDPDRLKYPIYQDPAKGIAARNATWDDFRAWARDHFSKFDSARGKGLAFLVDKKSSPSRDFIRQRLMQRFPQAMWVPYDATDTDNAARGSALAFGRPMREMLSFSEGGRPKAKVIVSLDRDFLEQTDAGTLINQREFATTRRVLTTADGMSRLYVVEPTYTITGSCADHRLRLAPSRVAAFAVALAKAVVAGAQGLAMGPVAQAINGINVPGGEDIPANFVSAVADDLLFEADEHGGKRSRVGETLVVAGPSQPPAVHALCAAINQALGNVGKTITYADMAADEASSSSAGIAALADALQQGGVTTLVCLNTNPVYNAPADLAFADKFKRATTICLSVEQTETAAAANWSLNGAHYLESWGDTQSIDGTVAPIQPMIAPLYAPALSDIELLALIADPNAAIMPPAPATPAAAAPGMEAPKQPRVDDGHEIVRAAWRVRMGGGVDDASFNRIWRRALHDGVVNHPAFAGKQAPAQVDFGAVAAELGKLELGPAPTEQALDVVFGVGQMHDGRFANNAWLQELPQPATRVVWDNPALLSPRTAEKLGLLPEKYKDLDPEAMYAKKFPSGRRATVTVNGRSIEIAAWVMPGMADNAVALVYGYGRGAGERGEVETCGRVGAQVGFNVFAVRDSKTGRTARGATVKAADGYYPISSTQNNWSIQERSSLIRQVDLVAWQKFGDPTQGTITERDRLYGTEKTLKFGERVGGGELTHTAPNINIYPNPFKDSPNPQRPGDRAPDTTKASDGNLIGKTQDGNLPNSTYSKGNQWGMSIDLSTCTGCGACTIACQAENNIAVVGKKEVAKNREMHWIRVDRYFSGDLENPDMMVHQPLACVHCENAPCETVCPVNATVHGPEGINYQVYNRCIGTRYCENNCPYKVRRFNFFDYGVTKFNGDYYFKDIIEDIPAPSSHGNGPTKYNKHNPNLIPPRLRQKLDEITRMQKNPNVTVRSRGVMEKCTYCIQRVNEARIESKLQDLKFIPDGFVQAACAQACPSDAIIFGDLNDTQSRGGKGSRAREMRQHERSFMLLGYLNTWPRTTHMVRVMNPNPRLRQPVENPFMHMPGEHGEPKGAHGVERSGGQVGMSRSTFLRDAAKKVADRGYALSLRVLGSVGV